MQPTTGLYIHIPFCTAKCPYCDFYSTVYTHSAAEAYVQAVERAMEQMSGRIACADTLYFGGGTPGLMPPELLARIVQGAKVHLGLTKSAEITLEANPGTITRDSMIQLQAAGFNRISLGVQSLQQGELEALGRRHTAGQAEEAILNAAQAGFKHISADVMLGIPGQDRGSLEQTLEALCRLPVNHVSAYLLKLEEGTPFARMDQSDLPDEDETVALYLDCVALLERASLVQYEISNFARPGGESRHNLKYWLCEEYLGLGPSAHSFLDGERFYFPRNLQDFLQAPEPMALKWADGPGGGFEEYAMLRLRLRRGLDLSLAAEQFGQVDGTGILSRASPLIKVGLVRREGDRLSLTPEGFLLSNSVTAALLFGA